MTNIPILVGREKAFAMKGSENENFAVSYFMHEAVLSDDDFTIAGFTYFRNDAAQMGKSGEFLHAIDNIFHDMLCFVRIVEGNVIIDFPQISQSTWSPDNFLQEYQALIFFTASECGIPFPCKISRSPLAMSSRI